jgi:hypothetical protein
MVEYPFSPDPDSAMAWRKAALKAADEAFETSKQATYGLAPWYRENATDRAKEAHMWTVAGIEAMFEQFMNAPDDSEQGKLAFRPIVEPQFYRKGGAVDTKGGPGR